MILLRTLGLSDIQAPGQPRAREVLAQPKRFAFLVYLALARPRGWVRRDALLARFWPDTDQLQARQVLRQTVYLLRQQLGQDAIQSRGKEELAVNASQVRCDVAEFEEALAEHRTAQALEHYHGDFLAALHVGDASAELEEWISAERHRLRGLAMEASRDLSTSEERAGNASGALFWARRAASLDPLDERPARDLVGLLARQADRTGALRVYEEYARRLKEELDVEPGPELRRDAEALRVTRPAAPPTGEGLRPQSRVPETTPALGPVANGAMPRPETPARRSPAYRWVIGVAAVLVLAGASGVITWARHKGANRPALLAVGPIATLEGGDTSRVAALAADLLSTSLARISSLHVVPLARLYELQGQLRAAGLPDTTMLAAARQAGAAELMQGTVHRQAGGGLQLDLQVMDLGSGALVHAYRARGADVFSMVDDATTLVARGHGVPSLPEPIADVTTQSIVAYRLYQEGLQAYRGEDLAVAYRLFLAALNEDSTFAMAAYYAGSTVPPGVSQEPLWVRAAHLAGHATDRERLWILEQVANNNYSPAVDAVAETLAVRYPEDPEARMALGDVFLHRGSWAAAAAAYRRVIEMDSLSLVAGRKGGSVRCLACEAFYRLWLTHVYGDSLPAALRVARESERRQPGTAGPLGNLANALGRMGRLTESAAALRVADSLRRGSVDLGLELAMLSIREARSRRPTRSSSCSDAAAPPTRRARPGGFSRSACGRRDAGAKRCPWREQPDRPSRKPPRCSRWDATARRRHPSGAGTPVSRSSPTSRDATPSSTPGCSPT